MRKLFLIILILFTFVVQSKDRELSGYILEHGVRTEALFIIDCKVSGKVFVGSLEKGIRYKTQDTINTILPNENIEVLFVYKEKEFRMKALPNSLSLPLNKRTYKFYEVHFENNGLFIVTYFKHHSQGYEFGTPPQSHYTKHKRIYTFKKGLLLHESLLFIKRAKKYFKNCPELVTAIKKGKFNKHVKGLKKIIAFYNNKCNK